MSNIVAPPSPDQATSSMDPVGTAPTLDRGRIAVIDDDAVFLDLMNDLLALGEGYEVLSTPDWLRGFEFIKEQQPDLVMLDLMLGREQTGWRVLQLLREDPATDHIPVIVCSAAAPALHQCGSPSEGHGAIATVAKPFDIDHLLALIASLLAGSKAPAV